MVYSCATYISNILLYHALVPDSVIYFPPSSLWVHKFMVLQLLALTLLAPGLIIFFTQGISDRKQKVIIFYAFLLFQINLCLQSVIKKNFQL